MTLDDFDQFSDLMNALYELYPQQKPLSDAALELFFNGLSCLTIDELQAALNRHLRNPDSGKWFPKIADILEAAGVTQNSQSARAQAENAAMLAWAKVRRALGSIGAYQSVVFDDAKIHAVISLMGGWVKLCQEQTESLIWREKEFIKLYANNAELPHPSHLIGLTEAENISKGYPAPKPRVIGNREACRLVYQTGQKHALPNAQAMKTIGEIVLGGAA
ncbi:DUF6475 domain-containing protein [Suttonella ornithocola]|uniref:DUF6475 domain-containing protein n=1 Tax=Suttonella ornithocola TaxID=279832 RepID=A0A380MSF5_9GAMM|nr:DUF6475 domain-containing protein [Suttonella ornithocola]SUO95218.1 Uncharacterised protein [Suttonella ornithocola]